MKGMAYHSPVPGSPPVRQRALKRDRDGIKPFPSARVIPQAAAVATASCMDLQWVICQGKKHARR
jgi:hypothetical protein